MPTRTLPREHLNMTSGRLLLASRLVFYVVTDENTQAFLHKGKALKRVKNLEAKGIKAKMVTSQQYVDEI